MVLYFSGAATYCLFLIYRMFQDQECSKTDLLSWMVIIIGSLFWIIVIPISILEVQTKAKNQMKSTSIQPFESESGDNKSPLTEH